MEIKFYKMPKILGEKYNEKLKPLTGSQTIVPVLREYPFTYMADVLEKTLFRAIDFSTQVLYSGEAEYFFKAPILELCKNVVKQYSVSAGTSVSFYTPGDVVRTFYRQNIVYSLIAEYLALYQPKDIALQLTLSMAVSQPLYQHVINPSFKDANLNTEEGTDVEGSTDRTKRNEIYQKNLNHFLTQDEIEAFNTYITSWVTTDALEASKPFEAAWRGLREKTNQGKGMTTSMLKRKELSNELSLIYSVIRAMLTPSTGNATVSIPSDVATQVRLDGMALAYMFLLYLDSIKEYDVRWPAMPFQARPEAWIPMLQSKAMTLGGAFAKAAIFPLNFEMDYIIKMFNMNLNVMKPLLQDVVTWSQTEKFIADGVGRFNAAVDPIVAIFTDRALEQMKTFTGADILVTREEGKDEKGNDLPTWYNVLKAITTAFRNSGSGKYSVDTEVNMTKLDDEDQTWPFLRLRTYTGAGHYSHAERHDMNKEIQSRWAFIESLIDMFVRTKSIMENVYGTVPIISEQWQLDGSKFYTPTMRGTLRQPQWMDFEYADPISSLIPKYEKRAAFDPKRKLKVRFYDDLLKVVFERRYWLKKVITENYYCWPGTTIIPDTWMNIGEFMNGVIPYIYTQERNADHEKYCIETFLNMIADQAVEWPAEEYFRQAAHMLIHFDAEYRNVLYAMLLANFSVWLAPEEGDTYGAPEKLPFIPIVSSVREGAGFKRYEESRQLPAIYGVSITDFIKVQEEMYKARYGGTLKEALESGYQENLVAKVHIVGEGYLFFALHLAFPKPEHVMTISYMPNKVAVWPVPVQSRLVAEYLKKNPAKDYPDPQEIAGIEMSKTADYKVLKAAYAKKTEAAIAEALAVMHDDIVSGKDTASLWLPPMAFSRLRKTAPHMTFDVILAQNFIRNTGDWDEFINFDCTVYQHPITKDLMYRGTINTEMYMFDGADLDSAIETTDPQLPSSSRKSQDDYIPEWEGKQTSKAVAAPERLVVQGVAAPRELSTSEAEAALHTPPVTTNAITGKLNLSSKANDDKGNKYPSGKGTNPPLTGSPREKLVDKGTGELIETKRDSKKKYYKKLVDGNIVDVVEVDDTTAPPEGYVPATAEEYAEFKKQS